MAFDYSSLSDRVKEICGTRAVFAKEIGLTEKTVSLKFNSKREWKQGEMVRACEVLKIEAAEIPQYFFEQTN